MRDADALGVLAYQLDDVGAALPCCVCRGRDVGQQYRGGIETVEFGAPPRGQVGQARVEPVYEVIPGWSETTAGARSWADLPAQAIKYVRRIEELIGAPVALL